ncbi:MAG: FAD-dependent oxidoreductase [Actinomycetota bacterium]|nr:FAD-dependent oxidoreductase [Actinomycetota bacterium]
MGQLDARNPSLWVATTPATSFPPLAGGLRADVAVVGGGITGLTTALLLSQRGSRVALIEKDRIAAGTTGYTTAKLTALHGLSYAELVARHGEEKARLYAEANQAAIERVASLVDELGIDCDFERQAAFTYTEDDQRQADIAGEVETAARLGLDADYVETSDLPFPIRAAIRLGNQAQFHPRRYCLALARAISEPSVILEQTRALDVDEDRDRAVVHTDRGDVVADRVVIATLLPFVDHGGFFARAHPSRSYAAALRVNGRVPAGMYLSIDSPTRSVRPVRLGDGAGLVVAGGGHRPGEEEDTGRCYDELEAWARGVFQVASVEHRWSAQDYVTVDLIPYVGRSPRMTRTFVATGFRKWGMTNGTAAAMILADTLLGKENPWVETFDATRIGDAQAVKKLVTENVGVARHFVGDRIGRLGAAPDVDELGRDQGRVVVIEGRTVGAYRDPEGRIHAVGLTCTHMGCTLRWNGAEASWDCPCHGSRFTVDGAVIEGPAVQPLPAVPLDQQ